MSKSDINSDANHTRCLAAEILAMIASLKEENLLKLAPEVADQALAADKPLACNWNSTQNSSAKFLTINFYNKGTEPIDQIIIARVNLQDILTSDILLIIIWNS